MPRSPDIHARQAEVGRRLAMLRTEAGVSQQEAAKRLGYSQSAVARFESGARRLTFLDALAFTALYGAPVSALSSDDAPLPGDDRSRNSL